MIDSHDDIDYVVCLVRERSDAAVANHRRQCVRYHAKGEAYSVLPNVMAHGK